VTPGDGIVDFDHVFRLCMSHGVVAPIILHSLPESGANKGLANIYVSLQMAADQHLGLVQPKERS